VSEPQQTNPLWHPFADMGAVDGNRLVLRRGEGCWLWDEAGREYLDATAALWYANLGHGRKEVADRVAEQMCELDAYGIFGDCANRPALDLAERLAALAGEPGWRVFLGSGGGDVIDTAGKLARAFHAHRGEEDRVHLIGRVGGYHGTHGIGTSVGGIVANADNFGPLVEQTSHVPFDDAVALEAEILDIGPEKVAAFFCEPVMGAGGVLHPPPGYIEETAAICKRHGVLFIADCVICGFGRLGTWLGIDRWPVRPDMITMAKGISAGVLPLGALLVAPQVAEPFFSGQAGGPVLRHGPTYAGHPTCCAAANVVLDIYEREGLIARGRELEDDLAEALAPVADHQLGGQVRAGLGLMAGADLDPDLLAEHPGAPVAWQLACREAGVLVRALGRGIAVSPPLVCTRSEIEMIGDRILAGLKDLEPRLAASASGGIAVGSAGSASDPSA
jgi:putrescine---pyruvate transaminase